MRRIPLSLGKYAIVDDADFKAVSRHKWHAHKHPNSRTWYAIRNIRLANGKRTVLPLHRDLMMPPKGLCVDHVNGNGLDNRRANLRVCTHAENCRNSAKKGTTSRFRGVFWCKGKRKWAASIKKNYRVYLLVRCGDETEAALYYDIAAQILFGEFARLNGV